MSYIFELANFVHDAAYIKYDTLHSWCTYCLLENSRFSIYAIHFSKRIQQFQFIQIKKKTRTEFAKNNM